MRIIPLMFVLLAAPAALAAQEGPRRGAPVPSRAVREADAIRPTVPKESTGARASRVPARQAPPAAPSKAPRGS